MASTGFTLAGAGANFNDGDANAWTSPGNITASDNSDAQVVLSGNISESLHATQFGFSIDAGATIDGIEVRLERAGSADNVQDHTIQLLISGSGSGDNNADTVSDWPTSDTNIDYGGAADTWGNSLSPSDVNATNFGVKVKAQGGTGKVGRTAYVDAVWINVHYTEAASGGASMLMGM